MESFLATKPQPVVSHGTPSRPPPNAPSGIVIPLVNHEVRERNLQLFDELLAGMIASRGDTPRLAALRPIARQAIARLPVVLLGSGMLNHHRRLSHGNENIANLLEAIVEADRLLRAGSCVNSADAVLRASAAVLHRDLEELRIAILHCIYECEFFSPEFALMLEALHD